MAASPTTAALEQYSGPVLAAGSQFGGYEIVRLLDHGGMGVVYEAHHTALKKPVALKLLHPNPLAAKSATERFLREGQAASRIRHPHVVDVTDIGTEHGLNYLVMELLEGQDLRSYMDAHGVLALEESLDILLPIISGVAAAHDAGIVHRDLKPANIFLARSSRGTGYIPKVLDFGVAKTFDATDSLTITSLVVGTPQYLSPEQAKDAKSVDGRSDQYALGLILYEMLTGEQPFQGKSLLDILSNIVQGDFVPPRKRRPDLPAKIEQAILRAMRFDPDLRYETARHFGRALLPFASPKIRAIFGDEFDNLSASVGPSSQPAMIGAGKSDTSTLAATPRELIQSPVTRPPAAGVRSDETTVVFAPARSRRTAMGIGAGILLMIGGLVASWTLADSSQPLPVASQAPESRTFAVRINSVPQTAILEIDGEQVGSGAVELEFPRDGQTRHLRVAAAGYVAQEYFFRDGPPPERIVLRAQDEESAPEVLDVRETPGAADGFETSDGTAEQSIAADSEHPEPEVEEPERSVVVSARSEQQVDEPAEPSAAGPVNAVPPQVRSRPNRSSAGTPSRVPSPIRRVNGSPIIFD